MVVHPWPKPLTASGAEVSLVIRMFSRTRRTLVALAVFAGLTTALWLESFGPHTDDGCRTEVHCLACRTGLVRTSTPQLAVSSAPALVALEPVAVQLPRPATDVLPSSLRSRGPPLSS